MKVNPAHFVCLFVSVFPYRFSATVASSYEDRLEIYRFLETDLYWYQQICTSYIICASKAGSRDFPQPPITCWYSVFQYASPLHSQFPVHIQCSVHMRLQITQYESCSVTGRPCLLYCIVTLSSIQKCVN